MTWKCENWKWPLMCSNPNISASTWPKLKIKDSFEILRTSRFQNWPYFLNLVKIWWRYWQKTNCLLFLWTRCIILLLSNNTKNGNILNIVILLGRKTLNCPIRMWTISRYRNNLTIVTREHRIVSYVPCCLIWLWHEASLKYAPCCHRQSVPVHDSNVELIKECVQSLCVPT